jgi:hypothetical protein
VTSFLERVRGMGLLSAEVLPMSSGIQAFSAGGLSPAGDQPGPPADIEATEEVIAALNAEEEADTPDGDEDPDEGGGG